MQTKRDLLDWLDANQAIFTQMADEIWANPEVALEEVKASRLQAEVLEEHGFQISWGSGGLPTAFIASWGKGKPVIGFIGEYDALKGLSQKAQPTQEPITPGDPGHACGHNLLGTGALAAALVIKNWLEEHGKEGTVRYYGCPAEETLVGKVYMARDGAFDDLDAAFNFHPGYTNSPSKGSMVGLNNLKFRFHGKSAHAGGAPHLGRSALDAVELMNVGVNYLREHVEENVRIHYAITHGGDLPNVVPPEAEVWYFVRAPHRDQVDAVTNRVRKIAQGAAMMTETTVEEIFITGCYNVLNNAYLADLQYANMQEIGEIAFTDEEKAFARQVGAGYPAEQVEGMYKSLHIPDELHGEPLIGANFPAQDEGRFETGSTDVGDVSWITPLSWLNTACFAIGATGHSWGIVATCAGSIGHKGMLHAAKTMALTAMDLFQDPQHLRKAREEFEAATKDKPYKTPLPPNATFARR